MGSGSATSSALGLDRAQLAGLPANGVRSSFLDSAAKQALLQEIEAVAAASFTGALSATAARGSRWGSSAIRPRKLQASFFA